MPIEEVKGFVWVHTYEPVSGEIHRKLGKWRVLSFIDEREAIREIVFSLRS